MHVPSQSSISRPVFFASQAPRCLSGANRIFWSFGSALMIFSALLLVTMMSECAFTAAEQLM